MQQPQHHLRTSRPKAFNNKPHPGHAREPWWAQPSLFFYVPCGLFWCTILLTYATTTTRQQQQQQLGLSTQDKAAVLCNPSRRPLATCAHRGNAAELLQGTSAAAASASVLQQMRLLWAAGVTCFDLDVVQLTGGDLIVGHPADLAAQVDAAALGLPASTNTTSTKVRAEQLHLFTLQQLRSAGLTADAAPSLQSVLAAFRQLLDTPSPAAQQQSATNNASSQTSVSTTVSVQEAAARRSWAGVPLISLEPKGPAATDAGAFLAVSALAAAAGVSNSTVLWLRQPVAAATAGDGGDNNSTAAGAADIVISDFAQGLRHSMDSSSGGSVVGQQHQPPSRQQRPLLGLIVADRLLQQQHLAALQQSQSQQQGGDASAVLTAALLQTAGGVLAHNSTLDGSIRAVDLFDVFAPSVRLPASVLQALLAHKPCLAWTLEGDAHTRKALWLGIDVGITNTPMAQLALVEKEQGTLCNT